MYLQTLEVSTQPRCWLCNTKLCPLYWYIGLQEVVLQICTWLASIQWQPSVLDTGHFTL